MAFTKADAGYQQTPDDPSTYALFFDEDTSGRPALGILVWAETANVEIYFDTIGTSSAPLTVVAGAEPVLIADTTAGIRKAYGRGGGTAEFSWAVTLR